MATEPEKSKITAGADEKTPSRAQYFSWINNTNEGSTEAQTLTNLAYFAWLREAYGVRLDIYAWDAGNLDGTQQTYEKAGSAKLKAQYPNGCGPCVRAAAAIGARLGMWCGPDGYGDTEEEAAARRELLVSLCRDHRFALFKIDGACGGLREEKQGEFVKTMRECRRYAPDLILLNHRLPLGKGEPYATTFLWNGDETYVDVHIANTRPAPHHRGYLFFRGNVPELRRMAEDHGVCLSSCPDYFDDELIYQAFGRCLILAPEIYGNPWLLSDRDQTRLARLFTLHRAFRDILVDGMLLPEACGPNAVARGDGARRLVVTGNPAWKTETVTIRLGREIGLAPCGRVSVALHHPYEEWLGFFAYGDEVRIPLPAFRAALIEAADAEKASPMLTGCRYEAFGDRDGTPDRVRIVSVSGEIGLASGGTVRPLSADELTASGLAGACADRFDRRPRDPVRVDGGFTRVAVTKDAERLYETAVFAGTNDTLERRTADRTGQSSIPAVKAARDAFFSQKTYRLRGGESRFAFDGRSDTFFDGVTKTFYGGAMRQVGACLRVDFGAVYEADSVVIDYFAADAETPEFRLQRASSEGDFSTDLSDWRRAPLSDDAEREPFVQEAVVNGVHSLTAVNGHMRRAVYTVGGAIRYLRICEPLDRIYRIAPEKDGREIPLSHPKVLCLLPHFGDRTVFGMQKAAVRIPRDRIRPGAYLTIGIDGVHGTEGVYAAAELDGRAVGCPDRAPSYPGVTWECFVRHADRGYTYYLPVTEEMADKEIAVYLIETDKKALEGCEAAVWVWDPRDGDLEDGKPLPEAAFPAV